MHLRNSCLLVSAAFASHASASFTGFLITLQHVVASGPGTAGQQLLVYSVFARFNSPTDTLLSCTDFRAITGEGALTGFWHKDNSSYNSGILTREFGSWNPSQTGSSTANRPYDSYLTIGGLASGTNTTQANDSWLSGGNADFRGWNRPDLPNNGSLGWFNSNPLNLQGQVGQPGNSPTDVRIGQFVLSPGHSERVFACSITYNGGTPGSATQTGTDTFAFFPAPGAIALLGLGGLAHFRRR